MNRRIKFLIVIFNIASWPVLAASAAYPISNQYNEATAAYQRGDFTHAAHILIEMERNGDANARGALSLMYIQGKGVPQDMRLAESLSKSAGLQGVPVAQHVQGLIHSEGPEEFRDYKEAIRWFTLAAENGYADSQTNLGVIYYEGRGVKPDLALGRLWTERAARQGFAPAQDNMGKLYLEGLGTPINYEKAIYWYAMSATQGYARALATLGVMHILGTGFPKNRVLAYAYFDIAGKRGSETARMNQARLHPQLTREELNRALRLSSAWKPGKPLPHE